MDATHALVPTRSEISTIVNTLVATLFLRQARESNEKAAFFVQAAYLALRDEKALAKERGASLRSTRALRSRRHCVVARKVPFKREGRMVEKVIAPFLPLPHQHNSTKGSGDLA